MDELRDLFTKAGFLGEIIGVTPSLWYSDKCNFSYSVPRGCEIDAWLYKGHGYRFRESDKYAILDDDSDMLLHQADSYFRVDEYCGLTPNLPYRIIKYLNTFDDSKLES